MGAHAYRALRVAYGRASHVTIKCNVYLHGRCACRGGRVQTRTKSDSMGPSRTCRRSAPAPRLGVRFQTWLILPVVICLSQRLSHARLSMNVLILKLRMARYKSFCAFGALSSGYQWELQRYYMIYCSFAPDGQWLPEWKPLTCCARGGLDMRHVLTSCVASLGLAKAIPHLSASDGRIVANRGSDG